MAHVPPAESRGGGGGGVSVLAAETSGSVKCVIHRPGLALAARMDVIRIIINSLLPLVCFLVWGC